MRSRADPAIPGIVHEGSMRVIGEIESLWRYPVKSMRGELLQQAFMGFAGVYGDRTHAFLSSTAPKGFPWLTVRDQPAMLLFTAKYRNPEHSIRPINLSEAEAMGAGVTPVYANFGDAMVEVQTPSGECFAINNPNLLATLRRGIVDREITLVRSDRSMTDCRPVSIISTQTVRQLGKESGLDLDKRRFRANICIDLNSGNAFGEDEFVSRTLKIGARCVIRVLQRDTRCKMITFDPETAEPTPDLMKLLACEHQSKAGVYGAVLVEGAIQLGDKIALLD